MVLRTQSSFGSTASSVFLQNQKTKQLSQLSASQKVVHFAKQNVNTNQKSTIISRKNSELPLFFDRCFDKNRIKTFIGWLLANFGENATVYVVEKLKNLGFHFATEAGISLSIDDLQVPSNKNWFLSQAEKDIKRNQNNFQCGNLTPVEQSQQLLDRWHRTSEILRESVIQSFRLTNTLNPVYMMAFSGARGNISQVRQLVGMRGLMADPQGQIISFPIRSNFREGLTLTEYVISCYGARKGVVDTALRTADSGYLTRRLVDVSQHVVVWTFDCKTDAGIHLTEMKEGKKVILSLKKRILGRVLAQEIPTIAFRNQQISAQLAQQIVSLREHVLVRSPLSCSVPNSVCQLCYGWSLSRGRIVSLGEAVGVIAAQSIGEPGTQLTMRTFHTGGVFSGDVIDEIRAPHDGWVRFLQPLLGQLIRTSHGKIAYLTRANGSFAIENNPIERKVLNLQESIKNNLIPVLPNKRFASQNINLTIINLEPGTALFVRQGEKVIAKQLLAEYSSISAQTKERVEAQHQVYSDQKGEIFFDDVILGKKLKKEDGVQTDLGKETEKEFVLNLQNQFKQGESELFTLPSIEQNIQKRDQQGGRKVDMVTSLKLNTLWILSGTFFEPPISSTLYTKIGDLVDKTTLLTLIKNELNLQTSHLDEEYILSAQLKKNKTQIIKRREKFLPFFRKNLAKLPKISQARDLQDDIKKRESLFLNKFSLNLVITNIKYKKSGYFFTSSKKEKAYNSYSLFEHFASQNVKTGNVNLFNHLIDLKNYKKNSKLSNWDLIFDKVETNFPSFINSHIVKKTEPFLKKEIKNVFVLKEPKGRRTFFLSKSILVQKPNKNVFLFKQKKEILRLFAADKVTKTEFVLGKSKQEAAFFLDFFSENTLPKSSSDTQNSRIFMLKYSKESAKAKNLWWRIYNLPLETWRQVFFYKVKKQSNYHESLIGDQLSAGPRFRRKTNLETSNEKRKVLRKNKTFLEAKMFPFLPNKKVLGKEKLIFAEQQLRENRKNVNHFFTTTSLNQPFSNCREFKNEFVLQWFSPLFKTETGGLIYTNNYYCNKRSTETQIFFIAEGNYGKKDLGKMNFGRRKKSFSIVSFKELIAPSICLTNVFLNGKTKPSSSFNNFPTSFSEDLANILFISKNVKEKSKIQTLQFSAHSNISHKRSDIAINVDDSVLSETLSFADAKMHFGKQNQVASHFDEVKMREQQNKEIETREPKNKKSSNFVEQNVFSGKIDFGRKQSDIMVTKLQLSQAMKDNRAVSINSLLNEISFLQNQNLDKEIFFLRKKENFNFYSVYFHSTKTETFNTTINLLKKGFFSFKNKWAETDIPLGYQKNLQGNQIPFYSTENGILKNNPAPSFFTNQYSKYWTKKKDQKLSGSFLKTFFPLIFKDPLPHIKVKKRDFCRKRGFFVDSLYLNKNRFFGQNEILVKNFNRKTSNEKLYQKLFWLADQQKKASKGTSFLESKEPIPKSALSFNPVKTKFYEKKSSFLYSKDQERFSLPFLLTRLHLNQTKKKIFKFNPFPSKGNYASSAFLFRINMRAVFSSNFQKESSLLYNPYPYSQPIFAEFLQNKSTANFYHLTKRLGTGLDDKHVILQSKTLFSKRSPREHFIPQNITQTQKSSNLTEIKVDLQNRSKTDAFALYSTQQQQNVQKQEKNFKNLKVVEDYKFPQNLISSNNTINQGDLFCETKCKEEGLNQRHKEKKINKFSSFLQRQIQKISTKKHKKIGENLQRSNLQIRPGWLYLPKNQFQTAKAHQSFIAPFQQNIDEILFDQFPVYIESILRENFEEQLSDKYLQPSTNIIDFYKTKTLVEKSQLQKFINQISTVSTKPKQSVPGLKISKERSNKFLLSLRETFWRGSTFSSFVENDFTTSCHNNKNVSKLNTKIDFGKERGNLYQTHFPTNLLNHSQISSTSSFLSFLLRNKKEKKTKYLQEKKTFSHISKVLQEENKGVSLQNSLFITKKEKKREKFLFLRPVSINPIKIVFQVVTNKSCRFNSIKSFALSCVNDINFDFSQDVFLQNDIIDRNLNQNDNCIEKKINPGFIFYLPQISRIYFVKNKPFSDFILVPRRLNFDQIQIKSHIFYDKKSISSTSEKEIFNPFLKKNKSAKETIVTNQTSVGDVSGETSESNRSDTFDQIKSKEQNWVERLTLLEKNQNFIFKGRRVLIPTNKISKILTFGETESKEFNQYKKLSKTLQNQTFLIQNFSTKVDTNYFSFLVLIPNSLKNEKNLNTMVATPQLPQTMELPQAMDQRSIVHGGEATVAAGYGTMTSIPEHSVEPNVQQVKNSFFDEIPSFQKKKASFSQFFSGRSKLWLLIRKVDEYPLLDTSIFQQKTRLYKGNQTFFEKELIYSSTPLSLYMSNRITFSSKFNKQKKKEIYLSFYHSPKVSLKIKEKAFYLLNTFSKLEKQHFANLSMVPSVFLQSQKIKQLPQTTSLIKNTFFDKTQFAVGNSDNVLASQKVRSTSETPSFADAKMHFGKQNQVAKQQNKEIDLDKSETQNNETKNNEDKLKLPLYLFSCQKIFWQIFDLHCQNVQKNKFFEEKQPLFENKTFDTERKDLLRDNVSFQGNQSRYKITVQKKTWFFQKENLENTSFPCQNSFWHQEKEETIIRSFKQSYLLHFFFNFYTSKQSPLQRIEIKTTFEKIEGSTQTSSCAHYLNSQKTHTNTKNDFFINRRDVKISDLNLQNKKPGYLQKNDGQSKFSAFSWLNISEIGFDCKNTLSNQQNSLFCETKWKEKLGIFLEKDFVGAKLDFRKQTSFFTKQSLLQNQDEIKLKSLQEKSKLCKYSFTPFARDLSFTLSFTAKLNQSWFFSLANNVQNKTKALSFEERKALQSFEFSTLQSEKPVREAFILESKTKQEYLKNKKSISKKSSSYPLKEKSSHTTLLLDQTITTYDNTPLAITAIMSKEEGEIENLKNNSASLILKNSDIEILSTKKEKPLVVVGQLIRYGEQIANGIAAPKSGQIIQVDTNRVTLRKAQPILFPRGGSVDVNHGDYVKEGSPLLSLSYQRLVTGDIVQGIPKIEQLFEARETEGGQPLLSSLHSELKAIFLSYSTQLGLKLAVRESFKEIQQIIVERVQRVYIAQGVLIADKHFEVVIRQMTSKVRILDGGRPGFLYGELVDLRRVELLNAGVPFANEQALYEPIILGISKACLEAEGFLSPASFQETTRVLSLAAIERKTDFLRGIKERVILGDVIQAGTGFTLYDRPVRKIKQEECIDLSLSVLQNAHFTLSTNQYYKQL